MTVTQHEAVDVILRDGSTLRLHEPGDADREALVRFFEGVCPPQLVPGVSREPSGGRASREPVLDPDWVEREDLLASVTEDGVARTVALANYVKAARSKERRGCLRRGR